MFKIIRIFTYSILAISLLACGQTAQSSEKETAEKISSAQDSQKKKGEKKKGKKALKQDNEYWTTLKKDLNLDDDTFKAARALNAKYDRTVKKLRTEAVEGYQKMIVTKRKQEKEELKKILGDDLFQKKLDFDKKWTAERFPKVVGDNPSSPR